MDPNIAATIKQICEEKNIPQEAVIETIEHALAAAYRKDFGEKNQNIKTEFDPETGETKVFDVKTVVEDMEIEEFDEEGGSTKKKEEKKSVKEGAILAEGKEKKEAAEKDKAEGKEEAKEEEGEEKRFNPKTEIMVSEAKKVKKSYKIGDIIRTPLEIPSDFGRMAAQTAKQVIIQRLREAERDVVFGEFKDKEGSIVGGVIQRREGRVILVDLNKATGVLPMDQQVDRENYAPGQRFKFYVMAVNSTPRGPEIVLSRTHPEIVKELFSLEIPEIGEGVVEIKSISREAGSRSKIAVSSNQENIDPIGSCIGQKGARIQTIISELSGEKIDVIEYNEDTMKFIAKALSPAKISSVELDEEKKAAAVSVPEDQFSLAIGRAGQNVRLAAQLTGWKINIQQEGGAADGETNESEVLGKEAAVEEAVEAPAENESAPVDENQENEPAEKEPAKEKPEEENPEEPAAKEEVRKESAE